MTPDEYLNLSNNTNMDNEAFSQFVNRMYGRVESVNDREFIDILHGAIGLSTESGEILDAIKKSLFYGKKLDMVNIKEEVGDAMWYCALILRATGSSFEEVMEMNIEKLKKRFGDKFSQEKALNRNLEEERNTLEMKESVNATFRKK
jgi:NTP pyrophosphatase (non-canonical NTP hydrolase)